jgi:hypothetical protein
MLALSRHPLHRVPHRSVVRGTLVVALRKCEPSLKHPKQKRAGREALLKIVSTLFSPKVGFALDLGGDAAWCASGLLPRLGPPDFNLSASLSWHCYLIFFALSSFSARIVQNSSSLRNDCDWARRSWTQAPRPAFAAGTTTERGKYGWREPYRSLLSRFTPWNKPGCGGVQSPGNQDRDSPSRHPAPLHD